MKQIVRGYPTGVDLTDGKLNVSAGDGNLSIEDGKKTWIENHYLLRSILKEATKIRKHLEVITEEEF